MDKAFTDLMTLFRFENFLKNCFAITLVCDRVLVKELLWRELLEN